MTHEDENYREFLKVIQLRDKLLSDPSKQNDIAMKRLKIEKKLREIYNSNSDCMVNVRQGRYDLISDENLKDLYTPIKDLSQAFVETYKTRKQREQEDALRAVRGKKVKSNDSSPILNQLAPSEATALLEQEQKQQEQIPFDNTGSLNQFLQQFQHTVVQKEQDQPAAVSAATAVPPETSNISTIAPTDVQTQLQLLKNMIELQNQQQAQLKLQQAQLLQTQAALNSGQSIPQQTQFNFPSLEHLQRLLVQQQQQQQQQFPQFYQPSQTQQQNFPVPPTTSVPPPPPPPTSAPPPPPPAVPPVSTPFVNMPIPTQSGVYIPPHPMHTKQNSYNNNYNNNSDSSGRGGSDNRVYYPSNADADGKSYNENSRQTADLHY